MKTYLLGAIFGVVMLFGVTVLVGVTGVSTYAQLQPALAHAPYAVVAIGFVGVLAGLVFKAGAVPGHFWVPDAAEGATIGVAAFVTTVPKIGALIALARLVAAMPAGVDAALLVAVIASVTMVLGTLAAFWQTDVRRLLGWSTVGQVGFLLMPVAVVGAAPNAVSSLLVYLIFYSVTNLALFAAVAALPRRRTIESWRGAGRRHPLLVGVVIVGLLSVVGTPPTVVFAGKLAVFTATWDGGYAWLVVLAAAVSVASLFYALRWISAAVRPGDESRLRARRGVDPASVAAVALGVATIIGTAAAPALLLL